MRIFKVLFLVLFFSSCVAKTVKQDPYLRHTIEKGETVYSISKKYNVTPFDIYRLNPDAKDGIKENTTLLIPKTTSSGAIETEEAKVTTHKVAPKETLYSLAKQYSVSVADLKEWNPDVEKHGLKIGQDLIVSKEYNTNVGIDHVEVQEVSSTTSISSHVVKTGETWYSLSRKYNVSVDELKSLNPQFSDGLNIGDTLKVKVQNEIKVTDNLQNKFYVVKPQETMYSLSKQFNISEDELIKLNPELNLGVKEGMVLKLPNGIMVNDSLAVTKPKANLLATIDFNTRKELVLFLPFNLAKMQSDSTKTYKEYINEREGKNLLNVVLDFYSGALVAIDSAKTLGLPVDIKILDVESSPRSSNVAQIISRSNFSNVDAIIGPFYNSHAETTAQLLSQNAIPVISPLSRDKSKPIPNLYNAVPSQTELSSALMDYLYSKEGNILAVVSDKKNASKEFLKNNHPLVKFPSIDEKGIVTLEAIKSLLVVDKKNYVILDSEKASQIMRVTNNLMKLKQEFDIQLVVFELYDTLDYEEVKMKSLTELHLLFPSVTKEPTTIEEKVAYEKLYKANKLDPNRYVVKGFDVTFDTLLRICQTEGFKNSIEKFATQGVENSFDYTNENGTWVNKAVSIQYYDTDYTIKTAE